ncbi:MAG: type II toxin-antitoxin system RelE/ParE family toxin [Candidatus Aminicenantes bacterium]|nr:type II toxin-antitoxin system RelE/ParE family toxin [Candidatus Aminicenantes bacterium]
MGKYEVLIKRSAANELSGIPKRNLRRIVERIRSLSDEPRPHGCQKLSAQERYRIRQGDYRIVYSIDDAAKTIEVFKIGHRSEIYKKEY